MNDRVRIYELARKMNVENQVLIDAFRELGYDVKSHSSTVDAHAVGLVIAHIGKKKQPQAQVETKAAPAAKASTGTKGGSSKAAPPPAPQVKPRVLARYRKEPVAPEVTEPQAEATPPAAPTPSPAVQQQQAAQAALAAAQAEAARKAALAAAAESAHTVNEAPAAPATHTEPEGSAPTVPTISKAVLEQRAQLEAIERANQRARRDKEQAAAARAAEEHARTQRDTERKRPGGAESGE